MVGYSNIPTPLGEIFLGFSPAGLCKVGLAGSEDAFLRWLLRVFKEPVAREESSRSGEAARQISAYLKGRLREFSLTLDIIGTPFQKRVWAALREIPYGKTRSYGEIAGLIRSPGASRAVGTACGRNPLPLVVPCHRVLAAGGAPGGFSCGLPIKKFLLDLEGAEVIFPAALCKENSMPVWNK
ncbi:MAG: methylated-DNA--[protein]-cysteine S-methyltransferase [bacterium]